MKISSKFKSIQSSIFCAVSILVLSAVLVVTVVSLRYTNSSIYENSVMYTQTIIKQLNQNIDSYISYMDNIASVIAQSGDAYKYLYSEKGYGATKDENYSEYRQRLVEQFKTILKGRADIRNIGIVREDKNSPSLFDNGLSVRNTYVDLNTQPWYADAVGKYDRYNLTSSHVQNVIKGERPWVITLSRGICNYTGTEAEDGVVFLDLNYSAISELCAQSSMGDKGYVFILDQNGNIVYHPQQQQLYNELQTENISLVMNAKSDIVTVGKGDDEKIYALSHSDITGWTIVGCMNMSELFLFCSCSFTFCSINSRILCVITLKDLVRLPISLSEITSISSISKFPFCTLFMESRSFWIGSVIFLAIRLEIRRATMISPTATST